MKNTMPLKSSTNSPRPNRAEAASSLPDAVASSSQPMPVPSIPASMVGPKPRRRLRRAMAAVAPSEPIPASIHSAPTRPALKPSSRAAYSTTIASDACRKICQTEIAQASARSTALRQIADNPSRISAPMLEARIFGASLGPERMPRRNQERQRIEQDRERRREPLDQRTGNSGTDELRGGVAHPDLGVRFDQIAAPDPFGHEDLVSRPTADRSESDEESDRIEHRHGERAEPRAKRHREQSQAARDVRPYDDRKLGHAVHQDAGEQAEQRERQRLERREDAHFERRRIEQQGAG